MSAKLLTEHHLEFLRLKGGCTDYSESTLVKMPHCWKSHDDKTLVLFDNFVTEMNFCTQRTLVAFFFIK